MDDARVALKVRDRLLGSLRHSHEYGLTADELSEAYGWGEHPAYTKHDWRIAVSQEHTLSGYWDWLVSRLDYEEHDESLV